MPRQTSITVGRRFGKLVTLGRTTRDKHGHLLWDCKCDCGNFHKIDGGQLLAGVTKSCGCGCGGIIKHGATAGSTAGRKVKMEYRSWYNAKARCFNQGDHNYKNYGSRGIRMCVEWVNSYEKFIAHMGDCPTGFTLDRVNNDGNYEPGNCRWASRLQQARNRRRSVIPRLMTIDMVL